MRHFKKGTIDRPGRYEVKIYWDEDDPTDYDKEIIEVFEAWEDSSMTKSLGLHSYNKDGSVSPIDTFDYDEYRRIGK